MSDIVNKNYEYYKNLLKENIKREDVTRLIHWLDNSDARVAPASSKYHLNVEGGLIQHSLNVYNRMMQLYSLDFGSYYKDAEVSNNNSNTEVEINWPNTIESITIVALLHDISKINFYERYSRNIKNSNTGVWESVEEYRIKDTQERFIYGTHSETSCYMVNKLIPTTFEEDTAILYHMGNLDKNDNTRDLCTMFRRNKLAYYLNTADMYATCVTDNLGIRENGPDNTESA